MFWAFMYWYFFGGGAGGINAGVLTPAAVEEMSKRVEVVVEEPARADDAREVLKALKEEVLDFENTFAASGKAIERSYRDHAADRSEIEAELDELNRDWARTQERALDLRYELREHLTREEWAALYAPRSRR